MDDGDIDVNQSDNLILLFDVLLMDKKEKLK